MRLEDARILVVDDNQELCRLVQNICCQGGFMQPEAACCCREAEQKLRDGGVDFLILDVNMPGEDGFSFFQRMQPVLEKRRIPVLFLSARDQDEDRLKGLGLGAGTVRTLDGSGKTVQFTNKEYQLVKLFLENRGRILTFDYLSESVWGKNYYDYENTLMVHIRKLREKIEEKPSEPEFLITVKGLGYRMNL